MSIFDRFSRLEQGNNAAPVSAANIVPSYRTPAFPGSPSGVIPAGARVRPQPPMTQYQQNLTPMGKRILQGLAEKREDQAGAPATPGAGQVGLDGQPKGTDSFMSRLMTPQSQGMLGAAAAGFEASGYQDRPVSLGQVLGRMGTAGMKSYTAAEDRKTKLASALAAAQRQKRLDEEKAGYDAEMLRLKKLEIEGVSGKAAAAEKLQESRLRRDLRKDFEGDAKYFGEAQQFWKDVVNYSKPEQSSASDLALVFSYMKMLDPDSVVREGEQMQVRGLGGIGSEARAFLSRLGVTTEGTYEGGMLIIDAPIRANIREAAALRFGDLAKSQAALEDYTAAEGARAGLSTDFFKSKIKGDGNVKRPYVVNTLDDLPETAKSGEYAVVNGVFMQIREQV